MDQDRITYQQCVRHPAFGVGMISNHRETDAQGRISVRFAIDYTIANRHPNPRLVKISDLTLSPTTRTEREGMVEIREYRAHVAEIDRQWRAAEKARYQEAKAQLDVPTVVALVKDLIIEYAKDDETAQVMLAVDCGQVAQAFAKLVGFDSYECPITGSDVTPVLVKAIDTGELDRCREKEWPGRTIGYGTSSRSWVYFPPGGLREAKLVKEARAKDRVVAAERQEALSMRAKSLGFDSVTYSKGYTEMAIDLDDFERMLNALDDYSDLRESF